MADCILYKLREVEDDGTTLKHILPRTMTHDLGDHGICRYDRKTCGCWGSISEKTFGNCRLGLTTKEQKEINELLKKAEGMISEAESRKPQNVYVKEPTNYKELINR